MEKVKKSHGISRAHKSRNHDLIRWTNRQEYLNDNSKLHTHIFVQVESVQINRELFLDSKEYLAVQE